MPKVFSVVLFLCLISCSKNKIAPASNLNRPGGVILSNVTRWVVTDLVRGNTPFISFGNVASNYIYLEMNPGGLYIADNGVNECNGRFTTDNESKIDFEEKIICTQATGDLLSYQQFKETLTKDVVVFTVNSDTTQLTFSYNSETYIKLKRVK